MYKNICSRFKIELNNNGVDDHDYSHGVVLSMPNGFNDDVGHTRCDMSVRELHDLKHLIEQALSFSVRHNK